jgi:hypothetical protein
VERADLGRGKATFAVTHEAVSIESSPRNRFQFESELAQDGSSLLLGIIGNPGEHHRGEGKTQLSVFGERVQVDLPRGTTQEQHVMALSNALRAKGFRVVGSYNHTMHELKTWLTIEKP